MAEEQLLKRITANPGYLLGRIQETGPCFKRPFQKKGYWSQLILISASLCSGVARCTADHKVTTFPIIKM